ncbi:MAG TPA: PAS domain S-box protein, partial [Gemmatimonadales bacterium]|nr:PAS domain S-box protein [Gemmatimonadales bacterium]
FPFITLYPAVLAAALLGGLGPGVLATVLGAVIASFLFILPAYPLAIANPLAQWDVGLFTISGLATAGLAEAKVRADRKLRAALTLAEEATAQAEEEAVRAEEESCRAEEEQLRAEEELVRAEEEKARADREAAKAVAAEQALRQREAELSDFFETASTGLHWVGADGLILRANQAELDMLGYEREEYVGHHIAEFHLDQPVIDDILRRLLSGEVITEHPARLRCKDGRIKEVSISSSAYQAEGRFIHTRCFTRDITGEKQASEAMARLAAVVSSSNDAIVTKTLEGVVTSWNAAAERLFGYSASEMVGQPVFNLIPAELHEAERVLLEQVKRGEMVEITETERVCKHGERIWISLSVSPVRGSSGEIIGAASIKHDVSERKTMEEHLRQNQRIQAVGQLAGGVAHEANNQMTVVLTAAHFLGRRSDLAPSAREDVEFIRQAAERTAAIAQQLLAFSRRQVLHLQDADLNQIVGSIEPVLRRSLSEQHELVVRRGLERGLIRADPRQIEQVLLNLTLNARDAMPEGGRVTIATCEATLQAGQTDEGWGGTPAGVYAALVVEDTGHGMDPATLKRAFEPFFTTKGVGQGTGLGLSVVHGIVNQTGGYIRVESEPAKGTTFTLYFPFASQAQVDDGTRFDEGPATDHERVALVVEDDPVVRLMAVRALVESGYEVLEATHGKEALDLVRGRRGPLDVVIADLGMPEMDGHELADCLRAEQPDLPIVFMSGYGDADTVRPFIQKPFTPDAL